ncbi:EPIDERMAL PATTERNING FACTOR-like protein 4 [Abeliophyllum distichum]|uniref:Epidermal patterning factor-like protein n=1 Tax=Abeliophyllum distichum TaxID=126358 RepID=A0ABD1TWI9_9LAMI
MSVLRRRSHHHLCTVSFATIAFLLLTSVSALGLNPTRQFKEVVERVLTRRRLGGGPGSTPPTCRSKCGKCSPCKPVHVSIQHRFIMPLEYYPEAWRCRCGNKLFMP